MTTESYYDFHGTRVSEIILDDANDTRALSLVTLAPNANGTYTQWTGGYTTINDIVLDGTCATTPSAGQTSTYGLTNLPTTTDSVLAVVTHLSTKTTADSPQHVAPALYTHSTLETGTFVSPTVDVMTPFQQIFRTNPQTGEVWTQAEVNALELGFQSAA